MAAANIATLNVLLTGSVKGLKSAFNAGNKAVAGFSNSLKSAFTGPNGIATLLTTGAVAATAAFVKSQAEAIDTVAKLSDRLGIQTEAIVGMQHAAELAGVSSEQLTGGLEKMLKSLNTAATEGGATAKAFQSIGLNAKDLINQSPEDAFNQIADGLAGIDNPAKRAATAMAIFGKSGQSLLPLLMSGSAGMKAAQADAEALGLTFSRMDAANVEEANDAITRMVSAVEGLGRSFAVGLAPEIEAVANKLTELVALYRKFDDHRRGSAASRGAEDYQGIREQLGLLGDDVAKAEQALARVRVTGDFAGKAAASELVVKKLREQLQLEYQLEEQRVKANMPMLRTERYYLNLTTRIFEAEQQAALFAKTQKGIETRAAAATAQQTAEMEKANEAAKEYERTQLRVEETLDEIYKSNEQFGMSEGEKTIEQLKSLGATGKQLREARELLAVSEELTAQAEQNQAAEEMWKSMEEQAQAVRDSLLTPLEEAQREMEKLQALYEAGLLTAEELGLAQQKVRDGLIEEQEPIKLESPKLLSRNSNEAFNLINSVQNRSKAMSTKIPEQHLTESKKQTKLLERLPADIAEQTAGLAESGLAVINV